MGLVTADVVVVLECRCCWSDLAWMTGWLKYRCCCSFAGVFRGQVRASEGDRGGRRSCWRRGSEHPHQDVAQPQGPGWGRVSLLLLFAAFLLVRRAHFLSVFVLFFNCFYVVFCFVFCCLFFCLFLFVCLVGWLVVLRWSFVCVGWGGGYVMLLLVLTYRCSGSSIVIVSVVVFSWWWC